MTADPAHQPEDAKPAPRPTPLSLVRGERKPAPVDLDTSPLPMWLRDGEAFRTGARNLRRTATRRTLAFLVQVPGILWWLGVVHPWRGLWRFIRWVAAFIYDQDSADLRHAHAGAMDSSEYAKVSRERKANLHARWLVAGLLVAPVAVPVLAWTYPVALSGIAAVLVFALVVKLIPGRGLEEVAVGAGLAVATYLGLPYALALIPRPPAWPFVLVGALVWLTFGWAGRPEGRKLLPGRGYQAAGVVEKPTADIVIDALVAAVPGITDKNRDTIRVHAPGVARGRLGYHISMELPPGSTVSDVAEKREPFAAAMRRQLGTVWPSAGHMHPGHLHLFIGDEPMATAPQRPWPLADGKPVDIFNALPLFTDQEGQWVDQRLAYTGWVIGGAPGYGKSFALRELGVAVAFDPRTRIVVLDGKGNGDLRPLRLVAHGYHEGDEPEDIAEQLRAVQRIREEMRRRARFLRELPAGENPEDKATSPLVDAYPDLAPIVLLIDECQVYTEHDDKKIREEFVAALADIVRRGRSAGIIPVFCTQKPSAEVIPTAITDNCSMRLCFRVNGQRANDAILGVEMHSSGIKATKFGADDKGLAWLKGDGAEPLVVRTVFGLDKPAAEALAARARAIRQARGLLTGYAAGAEAEQEQEQVRLLDDARFVMDQAGADRMHLATLLDRLALLRSGIYGVLDVEGLGAALRAAGVPTGQVKVDGRNTTGVRREALNIAATSDEDPDEDGGVVVSIR